MTFPNLKTFVRQEIERGKAQERLRKATLEEFGSGNKGRELADRMEHPQRYKKKLEIHEWELRNAATQRKKKEYKQLVKSAIRKLKRKKAKGIRARLKKFGKKPVKVPKVGLGKYLIGRRMKIQVQKFILRREVKK